MVVSGQQSSVGRGTGTPASQTGAACVPSSQSFAARPTDDCSPLTRSAHVRPPCSVRRLQPLHFLLERSARAPRSRGTCRSSRTPAPAARRPRAAPARTPSPRPRPATTPRAPPRRPPAPSRTSGRASPMATTAVARALERLAQQSEVAALETPADDRDDSRSKLSIERRAASTLVAFESLTKRTPPISATSSIACSSPREPLDARGHRRRRDARQRGRPAPRPSRRRRRCGPSRRTARAAPAAALARLRSTIHSPSTIDALGDRARRRERSRRAPRPRRASASAPGRRR